MEQLEIEGEFITLGQALKMTNTIGSGGMAKWFLSENPVYVNGEQENRRGKKLRDGDILNIPGTGRFRVTGASAGSADAH
ncbi:S4 domain-containing protein YaaA [Edaphobacillus lindanitolerans]|uniref:S4 domain protein YaaA n=1 Tax=Edaphobacillus lindanitolerans TaxID=550447 RepID=A0A1U7PKR8_9BACI|nr:S4 domain-containing protein YaaA [Edaphobacillus lindanitolerans]SIT87044.1 S4 domain protein YaaA [Edaphobacillus lindanitolerans]